MTKICYSSEVYGLDVEELLALHDSSNIPEKMPDDDVILLIGRRKLWVDNYPVTPDTLLKGRAKLAKAQELGLRYIPVRIAFESRIKSYDLISPLIRKLRYKHNLFSSNVYHMRPQEIREKGLERNLRTADNAYKFSNPKYQMSEEERHQTYEKLVTSMQQKGYDDRFPLDIMLCRNMGVKDTLNQGHHRMSVALECGINRVTVEFCAVGTPPKILQPFCRMLAHMNLSVKHFISRLRS